MNFLIRTRLGGLKIFSSRALAAVYTRRYWSGLSDADSVWWHVKSFPSWELRQSGFPDGCVLLFTGRKGADPDYYLEVNQEAFISWLQNSIFPKLQSRGGQLGLVLHQARYHTMLTEETRRPVLTWKISKMMDAAKIWSVPEDWPKCVVTQENNNLNICTFKNSDTDAKVSGKRRGR